MNETNSHITNHDDERASVAKSAMPKSLRWFFGVFMILFFGFVGLMLIFNWFNVIYDPSWNWLRWVGGPIFVLYGIFRAYRLFNADNV